MQLMFYTVSNCVLAAGENASKESNDQTLVKRTYDKGGGNCEGYYPGTMRQLEYAPKVESVIRTSTKK
jgi:hypothetical protein